MNFENYVDLGFQPSDLKEKNYDQSSYDSFLDLSRQDFCNSQAYEFTQLSKSSTALGFSLDADQFADSSYQIASDHEVSPAGSAPLNKKIQKQRKREVKTQEGSKRKGANRSVPKPVDDDEGAHPSGSCSCLSSCPADPPASERPIGQAENNSAATVIPKNLFELCVGYTMKMLKGALEGRDSNALSEVINCIGMETILAEYDSLLQSVEDFRREQRRSIGNVTTFVSQDRNSHLIKAVFCGIFTPGSASLRNYLLTTPRLKETNRNALKTPAILEMLRKKMGSDH